MLGAVNCKVHMHLNSGFELHANFNQTTTPTTTCGWLTSICQIFGTYDIQFMEKFCLMQVVILNYG